MSADTVTSLQNVMQVILTILTGGYATSYLTEFLKLSFIKIPAERYPRITATVVSLITAVVAVLAQGLTFGNDLFAMAGVGVGIFIISSAIYNSALKGLKTNTKTETNTTPRTQ